MTAYLRGSKDFQKVYRTGKRYEGVLMTAFVLPNNLSHNRFGVTASGRRWAMLFKESCQAIAQRDVSPEEIIAVQLTEKYDWVINAKRRLPSFKVSAAIEEFENLVLRVAKEESKTQTFG